MYKQVWDLDLLGKLDTSNMLHINHKSHMIPIYM